MPRRKDASRGVGAYTKEGSLVNGTSGNGTTTGGLKVSNGQQLQQANGKGINIMKRMGEIEDEIKLKQGQIEEIEKKIDAVKKQGDRPSELAQLRKTRDYERSQIEQLGWYLWTTCVHDMGGSMSSSSHEIVFLLLMDRIGAEGIAVGECQEWDPCCAHLRPALLHRLSVGLRGASPQVLLGTHSRRRQEGSRTSCGSRESVSRSSTPTTTIDWIAILSRDCLLSGPQLELDR